MKDEEREELRNNPTMRAAGRIWWALDDLSRDPDVFSSAALLRLLNLAQVLLTGFRPHWTEQDIVGMLRTVVRKAAYSEAGRQARGVPRHGRKTHLRLALELLAGNGFDDDEIIDILSDVDALSARGNPLTLPIVVDDETALNTDGVLTYYKLGTDPENTKTAPLAEVHRILKRIRRTANPA